MPRKTGAQSGATNHKPARALRAADPYLERERGKYQHPLPSREYILQIMEEIGAPVNSTELIDRLAIDSREVEPFTRRLQAMARDGQIMVNRRGDLCVAQKLALVPGVVQGHPEGFGFLIRDDGAPDMFLSAAQMAKVMHGDRVMAREAGLDRRGRIEGEIVEVLERANTKVVGRFLLEHGIGLVAPADKRIAHDILVPADARAGATPGQVVVVEVVQQPARHSPPIGRIVEILGNATDPGMEIEIALRKHQLPNEFAADAEAEAERVAKPVSAAERKGRKDLRSLPLVTIDGETARDFDDAVYCEPQGKGYKLFVAIADVSHYVKPGGALDREAMDRGNSVYFPRRVIPMLPEALSNGICSLNPGVDRLCMVCEMDIGAKGDIAKYEFYPAVMHSHARLTYDEVWSALTEPKGEAAKRRAELMPQLQALNQLFQVLVKARARRGAIDFETIETRMIFDDHGKIERIVRVERNDAHRIIEECMLAANVCASDFLQGHEHPALYRVHEGPTPEKLERLRAFLAEFGLSLGGGDEPHAKDYAKLLASIKSRPDAELLQTVMLRSLQQAQYSPEPLGHFGLAYESYTHFTSPIRRYPDLVIHRAIRAVLEGKSMRAGDLAELGKHCSMTERRADEATREVEAWLKCYYMQDRIGEVFDGTISGVAGFGVFVALDSVYVEGMIHISELGSDYFQFDQARHLLLGERTGKRYRLGDRLKVKLVRVDLELSRLDFLPAERS
ncbi:MAG: ribonuclease R [Burkholderiales bacterium]|jgi:ribonuclease R|nr:ribonuclease R [Burkholderiales bacterium]